jgi:hypothetical protein
MRERLLPNAEVLAARLTAMSAERGQVEARLDPTGASSQSCRQSYGR